MTPISKVGYRESEKNGESAPGNRLGLESHKMFSMQEMSLPTKAKSTNRAWRFLESLRNLEPFHVAGVGCMGRNKR